MVKTRLGLDLKAKTKICSICLSPTSKMGKPNNCNHKFCLKCIRRWSKIENTCPLCKGRFKSIEQISLCKSIVTRVYKVQKSSQISDELVLLPPIEPSNTVLRFIRNVDQGSEAIFPILVRAYRPDQVDTSDVSSQTIN